MSTLWLKRWYIYVFFSLGVFTIIFWFVIDGDDEKPVFVKSESRSISKPKDTANIILNEIVSPNSKISTQVDNVISLAELVSELKLLGVFRVAKGNRALIQSPLSARAKMYYQNDSVSFGITVGQILNDRVEITDGSESTWLLLEESQARQAAIQQYTSAPDSQTRQQAGTQVEAAHQLLMPLGLKYDPGSGRFIPDDNFK